MLPKLRQVPALHLVFAVKVLLADAGRLVARFPEGADIGRRPRWESVLEKGGTQLVWQYTVAARLTARVLAQ